MGLRFLRRCASFGSRLLGAVYKTVRIKILALECSDLPADATALPIERTEHFLEDAELRSAMQRNFSGEEEEIMRRQRLGDTCYGVRENSQVVHYSWVTRHQRCLKELGCQARLN